MKGLLDELRALAPRRPLTEREAYGIAERQATRLLKLKGITSGPVPSEIVTGLPYVKVHVRRLSSSSGGSKWIKPRWVMVLNRDEPTVRQRFSLFHEFKHIVDHPRMRSGLLRPDTETKYLGNERLCEFFSACVLMPRPWIKAAWTAGIQDHVALAKRFEVSPQAMQIRLVQLGLVEPYRRHGGEIHNDPLYLRSRPALPLGLAA